MRQNILMIYAIEPFINKDAVRIVTGLKAYM